jgi:DnaJ family protein C protein 17
MSDLEERERAFAAGGGQYVDLAELVRRKDKRVAAVIDHELKEFVARKNSRTSSSASTSVMSYFLEYIQFVCFFVLE